jgi:sec-independent protein translocase protein TatB
MLDMSWGEVMVIGAVALIVIGPKDLPRALRTVGNMTGKIRRMAAEFQGQFNEAMREAELDDVKRQIQGVNDSVTSSGKPFNPIQTIRDELKTSVEGTNLPALTPTPETVLPGDPVLEPLLPVELPEMPPPPSAADFLPPANESGSVADVKPDAVPAIDKPDAKAS